MLAINQTKRTLQVLPGLGRDLLQPTVILKVLRQAPRQPRQQGLPQTVSHSGRVNWGNLAGPDQIGDKRSPVMLAEPRPVCQILPQHLRGWRT